MIRKHGEFRPDYVLVEKAGSGYQLAQDFHQDGPIRLKAISPKGDKENRVFAQSAKIEAGRVWLPAQADWLNDFQLEVLAFPRGRHDDQVDSMVLFLVWIGAVQAKTRKRKNIVRRPIIRR